MRDLGSASMGDREDVLERDEDSKRQRHLNHCRRRQELPATSE